MTALANFDTFLVAWVASQDDLAALVGTRVSPAQNEQAAALPRLTYQRVSGGNIRSLRGPSGVARERYQINCVGSTQAEARQVARLVKGVRGDVRLDGYAGTLAGVTVQACLLEDERDSADAPAAGRGAATAYETQLDFMVGYSELA